MSQEEMEKLQKALEERLKYVDSVCICKSCPTYKKLGEEDDYISYCNPLRGKSKKIKKEAGCTCASCPVWKEMNFTKLFFCTRGTEQQQKEAES